MGAVRLELLGEEVGFVHRAHSFVSVRHRSDARKHADVTAARQTGGMHFAVDHEFPASCEAVAAVLCDPEFHAHLDLPDLSRPEVVDHTVDGTLRILKLRYGYIGQLDSIARKIVGGRKLTWIQELRLDTATYVGTLSFSAEEEPRKVNGAADVTIVATGNGCRRHIAGDFHLRIPVVGGTAEKKIVPGLTRRMDVEAAALTEKLNAPA